MRKSTRMMKTMRMKLKRMMCDFKQRLILEANFVESFVRYTYVVMRWICHRWFRLKKFEITAISSERVKRCVATSAM